MPSTSRAWSQSRPLDKSLRLITLIACLIALPAIWLNLRSYNLHDHHRGNCKPPRRPPASAAPESGTARPGERARILDHYNNFYEIGTEGLATVGSPKITFARWLTKPPNYENKTIGFVGLGRMGGNMARCLNDKGYKVAALFDINQNVATELAAEITQPLTSHSLKSPPMQTSFSRW